VCQYVLLYNKVLHCVCQYVLLCSKVLLPVLRDTVLQIYMFVLGTLLIQVSQIMT
jgi:hypothetical protein